MKRPSGSLTAVCEWTETVSSHGLRRYGRRSNSTHVQKYTTLHEHPSPHLCWWTSPLTSKVVEEVDYHVATSAPPDPNGESIWTCPARVDAVGVPLALGQRVVCATAGGRHARQPPPPPGWRRAARPHPHRPR